MMRMVCDTNYILNPEHRACPKLAELEKLLEECRDNPTSKSSSSPNGSGCSNWCASCATG